MNSIKDLVLKDQEAIAIKAISEKILTLMQNIRNGSSDNAYQRRWVWELLQNAMDTTNSERLTNVQILINESSNDLHFKHNGNPFKVNNLTYLINQQSSKPRLININERKRTIGKFGTGFITTHLLSEKVTLNSTLDAGGLGHKHFGLLLDRSGKDEKELFEGIQKSMEVLLKLDELPNAVGYDETQLNTEFIYHLQENGFKVAKIGIDDLEQSLPFTMAFVKNIESVDIINGNKYTYRGYEELSSNIRIHSITISDSETREILTIESSQIDAIVAIEVKKQGNQIKFIELNEHSPRLFCNYPFIGTELMNLPVIFNSSSFNVYQERRNGIILKNAETIEIIENKVLITECKNLYIQLLNFVSESTNNFTDTWVIADCKMPSNYEWLYDKWYNDNVFNPLKAAILSSRIVEFERQNIYSKRPIVGENGSMHFPYNSVANVRDQIYELCRVTTRFSLPLREQIHNWYKIFWWDVSKHALSVENLAYWFSQQQNISNIKKIVSEKENFIQWLENFINIFNKDEKIIGLINKNQLAIYPNQNGKFVTKNVIKLDSGIPEQLKDILFQLGVDERETLLNIDITILDAIAIDKERVLGIKDVAQKIVLQVNKFNSGKMQGAILSEEMQLTFKDLYIWLCENQQYSEDFGDLYEKKETRLLDEESIKLSIKNDQKAKVIFEKYGIKSIDELDNLIAKKTERKQKDLIKPELLLVSLGITSMEDLEKAKFMFAENKVISESLTHLTSNDFEKLERVLEMIKRSKYNVKNKLLSLPNYDCTQWFETSLTTVSGIKKNGVNIDIVIRPGDGDQIILFYPPEFEVLENNINELWYDKESEQAIYTFGKFLKKARISRMPI